MRLRQIGEDLEKIKIVAILLYRIRSDGLLCIKAIQKSYKIMLIGILMRVTSNGVRMASRSHVSLYTFLIWKYFDTWSSLIKVRSIFLSDAT